MTIRAASLIGAWVLVSVPVAIAGVIDPHLEKIEDCAQKSVVTGKELKRHSQTGVLYYHELTEADSRSVSYDMLKSFSLDGFIFAREASPVSTELEDDERVVLTGTVYRRDASLFEKLLAGGEDIYSYEAATDGKTYLLGMDQLSSLPSRVCSEFHTDE